MHGHPAQIGGGVVTDVAYVPTSTEFAVRAALASIYSGAGLVEARALIDQLEDRGYRVAPVERTQRG